MGTTACILVAIFVHIVIDYVLETKDEKTGFRWRSIWIARKSIWVAIPIVVIAILWLADSITVHGTNIIPLVLVGWVVGYAWTGGFRKNDSNRLSGRVSKPRR